SSIRGNCRASSEGSRGFDDETLNQLGLSVLIHHSTGALQFLCRSVSGRGVPVNSFVRLIFYSQ
ncbi:MAG: hypothetical protein RIR52_2619, partial [Acidobacteriota bacterium]